MSLPLLFHEYGIKQSEERASGHYRGCKDGWLGCPWHAERVFAPTSHLRHLFRQGDVISVVAVAVVVVAVVKASWGWRSKRVRARSNEEKSAWLLPIP